MITALSIKPLLRSSMDRLISSMAKTIPAGGVPKAAAIPAAPPARIRPRCMSCRRMPAWLPNPYSNGAPIWTVGANTPTDPPQISAAQVSRILPTAMRNERRRIRIPRSTILIAAIAWGIPLPSAPLNHKRVNQAVSASPSGVTIKGSHGHSATVA